MNNIDLVARAHQLVMEGYKHMHDKKIVTVWSAPKYVLLSLRLRVVRLTDPFFCFRSYCYRCGNIASILQLDENLEQKYISFEAAAQEAKGIPAKRPLPEYCEFLPAILTRSLRALTLVSFFRALSTVL